jgi:hypothetical protein
MGILAFAKLSRYTPRYHGLQIIAERLPKALV